MRSLISLSQFLRVVLPTLSYFCYSLQFTMQNRGTRCLKKVLYYGKIKENFCARKSKEIP